MKLLFLFVLITMLVQTQLNAQTTPADFIANVPPAGRMLFRRLETGHLYCGEDSEEIIKLSKVGGITLPLMDLIKKTYREHGDENVGRSTLYALDQRVDLTEEDIAWVRGMLDEMLNYTHQDGFAHIFKEQGLFLLRHYPSPANEDILIKYLQPNNVQNVISFGYASAIGLNLIGTSKSLAALEAFRKTCDARFDDYKDATQAITRINEREGLKDRTPNDQTSSKQPQALPKSPVHPQTATPDAAHEPTSQGWLVWLLVVIAATVSAVWVFSRKSK